MKTIAVVLVIVLAISVTPAVAPPPIPGGGSSPSDPGVGNSLPSFGIVAPGFGPEGIIELLGFAGGSMYLLRKRLSRKV